MTFGPVDEASASFMVIEELVKMCGRNYEPANMPFPPSFLPGCFAQYGSVSENKSEKRREMRKEKCCKGKKLWNANCSWFVVKFVVNCCKVMLKNAAICL